MSNRSLSRQEGNGPRLLQKVSSALSRLVAPITSSAARQSGQTSNSGTGFRRFEGKNPKERQPDSNPGGSENPEQPSAQIIPFPIDSTKALAAPAPINLGAMSIAHSLVALLSLVSEQPKAMAQWFGKRAYRATRSLSKGTRFKKGSMLDIHRE